ncbi:MULTISPECIES: hypothetical protein [Halomicrobium]|uniref:Uncharacterized protein n=2 Tax=Halomicrobium mukohataei TaxID=57705 RepID=C7P2D9_HALMD|nr:MULTISPECIES: hypothetical protein [Halomicrobium]ACV49254.1 hypothetical protein Hmuk_3149 [Halomicrobium mukohataei DSM 12286]QCD64656.1 hypothetical protein E5139_02980 [Halomicrobium mukohataei]QFR19463.1 hypothetical protein GBQ70_02980 [Halomicrobium sp. ZPS1]
MTDEFSVFRFDVDAEAMRALLESLGVEPSVPAAFEPDEIDDERASEPHGERTGPRVGETPPPGAGDQNAADDSPEASDGGRRTLLVAAAGTAVVLLTVLAVVVYRRRSGETLPDVPIPDVGTLPGPFGDADEPSPERSRSAADGETVDAAPLVGMALLSLGGAVLRRVQRPDDRDR